MMSFGSKLAKSYFKPKNRCHGSKTMKWALILIGMPMNSFCTIESNFPLNDYKMNWWNQRKPQNYSIDLCLNFYLSIKMCIEYEWYWRLPCCQSIAYPVFSKFIFRTQSVVSMMWFKKDKCLYKKQYESEKRWLRHFWCIRMILDFVWFLAATNKGKIDICVWFKTSILINRGDEGRKIRRQTISNRKEPIPFWYCLRSSFLLFFFRYNHYYSWSL